MLIIPGLLLTALTVIAKVPMLPSELGINSNNVDMLAKSDQKASERIMVIRS